MADFNLDMSRIAFYHAVVRTALERRGNLDIKGTLYVRHFLQ